MTGVQQVVDAAFATAARRWERILAVVRVVLCTVMFVRTALIWKFAGHVMEPMALRGALFIAGSVAVIRSSAPVERLLRIGAARLLRALADCSTFETASDRDTQ